MVQRFFMPGVPSSPAFYRPAFPAAWFSLRRAQACVPYRALGGRLAAALLVLMLSAGSAGVAVAQDVMVLPPEATGQPSLYINDTPAATPDAPEPADDTAEPQAAAVAPSSEPSSAPSSELSSSLPPPDPTPPAPLLAREEAVTQAASAGAAGMQCARDADCVALDSNCTASPVANRSYIADWKRTATRDPACGPMLAPVKGQSVPQAVCRKGICGLMPGVMP